MAHGGGHCHGFSDFRIRRPCCARLSGVRMNAVCAGDLSCHAKRNKLSRLGIQLGVLAAKRPIPLERCSQRMGRIGVGEEFGCVARDRTGG